MILEKDELQGGAHYNKRVQAIEVLQANLTPEEFKGFLKGNIVKYCCRCGRKDTELSDAQKILIYALWHYKAVKGEVIDPRKIDL